MLPKGKWIHKIYLLFLRTVQTQESATSRTFAKLAFWLLSRHPGVPKYFLHLPGLHSGATAIPLGLEIRLPLPTSHVLPTYLGQQANSLPQPITKLILHIIWFPISKKTHTLSILPILWNCFFFFLITEKISNLWNPDLNLAGYYALLIFLFKRKIANVQWLV